MRHPTMKEYLNPYLLTENKAKTYSVSGLTRILSGHVDKKTDKRLYSVMGWQLLGVRL